MGRWTYYSPSLLGAALAVITFLTYEEMLPPWSGWQRGLMLIGSAMGCGLLCQLAMLACQGAFAQVLPVPGGRSIRGGSAAAAGWALLGALVLALATFLLAVERVRTGTLVAGVLAGILAGAAAVIYVWNWPIAVRDFREGR